MPDRTRDELLRLAEDQGAWPTAEYIEAFSADVVRDLLLDLADLTTSHEDLAHEHLALRPIAEALAAISGDDVLNVVGDACSLCLDGPGDFDHDPGCPWALAKTWAAEHATDPAAGSAPESEATP